MLPLIFYLIMRHRRDRSLPTVVFQTWSSKSSRVTTPQSSHTDKQALVRLSQWKATSMEWAIKDSLCRSLSRERTKELYHGRSACYSNWLSRRVEQAGRSSLFTAPISRSTKKECTIFWISRIWNDWWPMDLAWNLNGIKIISKLRICIHLNVDRRRTSWLSTTLELRIKLWPPIIWIMQVVAHIRCWSWQSSVSMERTLTTPSLVPSNLLTWLVVRDNLKQATLRRRSQLILTRVCWPFAKWSLLWLSVATANKATSHIVTPSSHVYCVNPSVVTVTLSCLHVSTLVTPRWTRISPL